MKRGAGATLRLKSRDVSFFRLFSILMWKALPIGSADFSALRENHEIYVDKTDLIHRMACSRESFFLTRPRRFGKSLLISTLESLFRDGLRCFRGLAIEHLWQDKT